MHNEPGGLVTRAEQRELDTLRGRAYAEDADIFDDVSALSRLRELEDRVRVEHFSPPAEWTVEFSLAILHARSQTALEPLEIDSSRQAPGGPPTPPGAGGRSAVGQGPTAMRWHEVLVATTASVSVLLAAWAWMGADHGTTVEPSPIAAADGPGSTTYAALYDLHLENLREELLSGPGMEEIGGRLVPALLRPQGMLYGRAVGAGPTRDEEFCMIVADTPEPAVACVSADETERTVSVLLPPASADSSDSPPAAAEFVRYSLSAEGIVVAEPVQPGGS